MASGSEGRLLNDSQAAFRINGRSPIAERVPCVAAGAQSRFTSTMIWQDHTKRVNQHKKLRDQEGEVGENLKGEVGGRKL